MLLMRHRHRQRPEAHKIKHKQGTFFALAGLYKIKIKITAELLLDLL